MVGRPQAERAPGPRLDAVGQVEWVLREAAQSGEGPLPYTEIQKRLVTNPSPHRIRHAVQHLRRFRLVAEGSRGVMWVLEPVEAR